jgi:hypothetical protein
MPQHTARTAELQQKQGLVSLAKPAKTEVLLEVTVYEPL